MANVNETILNQTFNRFKVTGYVEEMGMMELQSNGEWGRVPLRIVKGTRDKYVDGVKTDTKIECEQLRGTLTIKTNDGVQEFNVNFNSLKSNGEPDKRWDMAKKIMDWVPAINPPKEKQGMTPTYVTLQGNVGIYDNVGKDEKVYSNLQWSANAKCQHANTDEASGCSLVGKFYLNNYREETIQRGDDTEETGRLIVELYGADNKGQCYPVTCYVEADMADDFTECFEAGQTLDCEFNRIVRHVGSEKPKKRAFGGGKTNVSVSSGFDVQELILVGADIIDEPDELTTTDDEGNEIPVKTQWINPTAMKKAINVRKQMLEEMKNNPNKKKSSGLTSLQAKKQAAREAMRSGMKNSFPTDDLPFDALDDDDIDF